MGNKDLLTKEQIREFILLYYYGKWKDKKSKEEYLKFLIEGNPSLKDKNIEVIILEYIIDLSKELKAHPDDIINVYKNKEIKRK